MIIRTIGTTMIVDINFKHLNKDTFHKFKKRLLNIYLSSSYDNMVLNFKAVESIDSKGLDALLFAGTLVQQENGKISFYGLRPPVIKVLMQSRLYRFFDINRTEDASLEFVNDSSMNSIWQYSNLKKKLKTISA